jgi:hypothetical protein
MSAMATAKKTTVDLDLDKELGIADDGTAETKTIRLLGREWTVVCDLNSFAMAQIAAGDSAGVAGFLVNLIAEDQQEDFGLALASAKNMNADRLGTILQKLIEVAGERPTAQPSPSPRTAKNRTSSLKSVGS